MLRYNFLCGSGHTFSAWFKDKEFFVSQYGETGAPACPICESNASITSCENNTKRLKKNRLELFKFNKKTANSVQVCADALKVTRKLVESQFAYVGRNLFSVAVKMLEGVIDPVPIYGEITMKDIHLMVLYYETVFMPFSLPRGKQDPNDWIKGFINFMPKNRAGE